MGISVFTCTTTFLVYTTQVKCGALRLVNLEVISKVLFTSEHKRNGFCVAFVNQK